MVQIEIEYLTEDGDKHVKRYEGEPMVCGQAYWFGVYWRLKSDALQPATLLKDCITHDEASRYATALRAEAGFKDAEIVDHSQAFR